MNIDKIISFIENKNVLEIGGPSELLFDIYSRVQNISLLNLSQSKEYHDGCENPPNIDKVYDGDAAKNEVFLDNNLLESFEIIITSHTLEHIANPIKALSIWKKCLIPSGCIINIVPNKTEFWDRDRDYTSNEHLLQDYISNITENDMTHVEEASCMPRPNFFEEVGEYNESRIIHHHVFDISNLTFIHEYSGFKTENCYIDDTDRLQLVYIGRK